MGTRERAGWGLTAVVLMGACSGAWTAPGERPARLEPRPATPAERVFDGSGMWIAPAGDDGTLRATLSAAPSHAPAVAPRVAPLDGRAAARLFAAWTAPEAPSRDHAAPALTPPAGSPSPPVRPAGAPPLRVERIAPSGAVVDARELTIAFSEPMTALGDVAARPLQAAVRIDPPVLGHFHWLSTRLLAFTPALRLPRATRFRIAIPAGLRAVSGAALAADVQAELVTAAPALVERHRDGKEPSGVLEPVRVLEFDMPVDAARIAAEARYVTAQGEIPARTLPWEALAGRGTLEFVAQRLRAQAALDHAVLLAPAEPLPEDSAVVFRTGPIHALEGPLVGPAVEEPLRTHGELRLAELDCPAPCWPDSPVTVRFSNGLALPIDPRTLIVTPTAPITQATLTDTELTLQIDGQPHTRYTLELPGGLRDVYGQPLRGPRRAHFNTGPRLPQLSRAEGELAELNPLMVPPPDAAPALRVAAAGLAELEVAVERVQLGELEKFAAFYRRRYAVRDKRYPFSAKAERRRIPLRPDDAGELALPLDGIGPGEHAIVEVWPVYGGPRSERARPQHVFVTRTRLAIDHALDGDHMVVWVSDLESGAPVPDAEVGLVDVGPLRRSDAHGFARVPLPTASRNAPYLLRARRGDDAMFVCEPLHEAGDRSPWQARARADEGRVYAFADRAVYAPGESVYVKGYARVASGSGGTLSLPRRPTSIQYALTANTGHTLLRGAVALDARAEFGLTLPLPAELASGAAAIEFEADTLGARFVLPLQLAALTRPSFEAELTPSASSVVVGEPIGLTLAAHYFTGGPVPSARVTLSVTSEPTAVALPQHADFVFGRAPEDVWAYGGREPFVRHTLATDRDGLARARYVALSDRTAAPRRMIVEAESEDRDHQRWLERASFVQHPARVYAGLRLVGAFPGAGAPLPFETIAADLLGALQTGVEVTLSLDEVGPQRTEVDRCTLRSANTPTRCPLVPRRSGPHRLVAELADPEGRLSRTELGVEVAAVVGEGAQLGARLKFDRSAYEVGELATLRVIPPSAPCHAWLRIGRAGREEDRMLALSGPSDVAIRVHEADAPGLSVRVQFAPEFHALQQLAAVDFGASAFAAVRFGGARLSVSVQPETPRATPGAATAVRVQVADAAGQLVPGARVALFVVDAAAHAAGPYLLPDPLVALRPPRAELEGAGSTRSESADLTIFHPESGSMEPGNSALPSRPRQRFTPTAHVATTLETGPDGAVRAAFTLPDDLTRYRVLAVASAGADRFGVGEGEFAASRPLMVRLAPPAFARPGDRITLTALVENAGPTRDEVHVALRAAGAELVSRPGFRLSLGPSERAPVRFTVHAGTPGAMALQIVARGQAAEDVAQHLVPIAERASREHFASYGALAPGATLQERIVIPEGVLADEGDVALQLDGSPVLALRDAYDGLAREELPTADSLAGRVLAQTALLRLAADLGARGAARVAGELARDVAALDGLAAYVGVRAFPKDDLADPFATVLVAEALELAARVRPQHTSRALIAARAYIDGPMDRDLERFGADTRLWLRAHALRARALRGVDVVAELVALHRALDRDGSVELLALVGASLPAGHALRREIVATLRGRVAESARLVGVVAGRSEVRYPSALARQARVLALWADEPADGLTVKLAEGLIAARVAGRFASTLDTGFALTALAHYLTRHAAAPRDLRVRAQIGAHVFDPAPITLGAGALFSLPLGALRGGSSVDASVVREGEGALFYRLGLDVLRPGRALAPVDQGFSVERRYEALDDPRDVTPLSGGGYRIRAGARVAVSVSVVVRTPSYAVALEDPLPAGFEVILPELQPGFDGLPPSGVNHGLDVRDVRSDRLLGFVQALAPGSFHHTYTAIARTPGRYGVPGTQLAQRYAPESYGRARGDLVEIVE